MMNALTPKVIDIIARPFILVPEQSMAFFSSITKGSRVCCRLINVHYFAVSLSFGILIAHFNPRSLSAFAAVVTPFIFIPEERIISGVPTCQGFLHSSSEGLPCDTHTHTRGRKSNSTIEGGRGYLTQKKIRTFYCLVTTATNDCQPFGFHTTPQNRLCDNFSCYCVLLCHHMYVDWVEMFQTEKNFCMNLAHI